MRDSTIVRAMHQPGDSSVRVGVVAGDRREAVRRALDEDRGATTERTQPAIEVRSVADGERAAGAVTDSAVDCVVCATAAVYEAVRAADRQAPVVAFGPVEQPVGRSRSERDRLQPSVVVGADVVRMLVAVGVGDIFASEFNLWHSQIILEYHQHKNIRNY